MPLPVLLLEARHQDMLETRVESSIVDIGASSSSQKALDPVHRDGCSCIIQNGVDTIMEGFLDLHLLGRRGLALRGLALDPG